MATYWENSCSFGLRYVSWYKYLIVGLVFSHLGFWSGNLFLIAPFPDLCLLVPSYRISECQIMFLLYWHRNPGSLRVVRTSRRPFQTVLYGLRRSNQAFTLLAPESCKSASGLVVSQTDAFDSGGSCESKYMLKLIGTGILEVCEWSDSVADRRFRLRRVLGVKIYA